MSANCIPTKMPVPPEVAGGHEHEPESGCQHVVDYYWGSDSVSGVDRADGDIYDKDGKIRGGII